MRAVKGTLGHSLNVRLKRIRRPSPGLMARLGVPVGGRVRKLRAVEDQSAPIPEDNERAWRDGEGAARCPSSSQNAHDETCARPMRAAKGSLGHSSVCSLLYILPIDDSSNMGDIEA